MLITVLISFNYYETMKSYTHAHIRNNSLGLILMLILSFELVKVHYISET